MVLFYACDLLQHALRAKMRFFVFDFLMFADRYLSCFFVVFQWGNFYGLQYLSRAVVTKAFGYRVTSTVRTMFISLREHCFVSFLRFECN